MRSSNSAINNGSHPVAPQVKTIRILMTHVRRPGNTISPETCMGQQFLSSPHPPPRIYFCNRIIITLHSHHNKPSSRTTDHSTIPAHTRFDTRILCTIKRTLHNEQAKRCPVVKGNHTVERLGLKVLPMGRDSRFLILRKRGYR